MADLVLLNLLKFDNVCKTYLALLSISCLLYVLDHGTIYLTSDWAKGGDSKHCAYSINIV